MWKLEKDPFGDAWALFCIEQFIAKLYDVITEAVNNECVYVESDIEY
jgi:hypothetical protein